LIERGWDDIVGIDKSGVPTDIGSTAHASDFCYTTSHDYLSVWTTQYSIEFFDKMGALRPHRRAGDRARRRRCLDGGGQAQDFLRQGLRHPRQLVIGPAEVKEKFPLVEEEMVQGGLVGPGCRSGCAAVARRLPASWSTWARKWQAEILRQHTGLSR
jgi:hypothetical protein